MKKLNKQNDKQIGLLKHNKYKNKKQIKYLMELNIISTKSSTK